MSLEEWKELIEAIKQGTAAAGELAARAATLQALLLNGRSTNYEDGRASLRKEVDTIMKDVVRP